MSQIKLLLDSNAYLRTARTIHPLLFQTFKEKEYCLYVIDDFEKEFLRNPRLVNKFSWVTEYQYRGKQFSYKVYPRYLHPIHRNSTNLSGCNPPHRRKRKQRHDRKISGSQNQIPDSVIHATFP